MPHYLSQRLEECGFKRVHEGEFFHEFVTSCPCDASVLEKELAERGILSGLPVEDGILWCCTELNSKQQIDELIEAIQEVLS